MMSDQSRLFIHATNVHQGGGRTLLDALLKEIPVSSGVLALLDSRMPIPEGILEGTQVKRVKPSVIDRLKADQWLAKNVNQGDIVLCFGNLPPLFKLKGRAIVFLQNRYLIDDIRLDNFPLKTRARLCIERLWLSSRMLNADEFIVQSPTMKRLMEVRTQGRMPVRVLPFMAEPKGYKRSIAKTTKQKSERYDFMYVATGGSHKNHRRIIEAWCLLTEVGLYPSLRVTLDETHSRTLCRYIEEMRLQFGLKVKNMGELSHTEALALYKSGGALIFPSTFESFGLPLIEARQAGLRVLAPELDYVRDVLDPEQTFDPESSMSIARAVKRFLGVDEPPLPLLDAKRFLELVVGTSEVLKGGK